MKDIDQVSQLGMYTLWDGREFGPIELTLQPQWRWVKSGFCLTLDLPTADFASDAIVLTRDVDPQSGSVKLTLIGETPAKHDYALGKTGTPPPTPALGQTAEERDAIAAATNDPPRAAHEIILFDPPVWPFSSDDTSITVAAFAGTLDDSRTIIFPSSTLSSLTPGVKFGMFYDLAAEEWQAVPEPALAQRADSDLAFGGWHSTSTLGEWPEAPPPPGGAGGNGNFYEYRIVAP